MIKKMSQWRDCYKHRQIFRLSKITISFLCAIFFVFFLACSKQEDVVEQQEEQTTEETESSATQQTPPQEQPAPKEDQPVENRAITYVNKKYNFQLLLPPDWEGKYQIEEIKEEETESSIYFFHEEEKIYLFSIHVFSMTREDWENQYKHSEWIFIEEKNGKIFTYATPSGLDSRLNEDKAEKLRLLIDVTKMVNYDIPRVIKTFNFTS